VFVLPAESCLAAITEDVSHGVESCQQHSLLCRAAADVDHGVEQVGTALAALEGFADEFVVVGKMSSAVDTGVCSVAVRQVLSEGLRDLLLLHLVASLLLGGAHGGLLVRHWGVVGVLPGRRPTVGLAGPGRLEKKTI